MKASDIVKKKEKKMAGKKGKSNALIDWIGKRRQGVKKTTERDDEGDHEYR